MTTNERKDFAATMHVDAAPETVFPLLCPVREYDWIEQWQCTMVYTRSGYAEPGCVFQTAFKNDAGGDEITDTWVVCRHEPDREVAFVRNNGHRTILYTITLEPDIRGTRMTWKQQLTGLTPEGNDMVRAATQAEFTTLVASLEIMLDHYCITGRRLSADDVRERLAGAS